MSAAAATPEKQVTPTSPGADLMSPGMVSPTSGRVSIHRGVEKAVELMWNNQFAEADAILNTKKDSNPRFALESAMVVAVKGLMNATNSNREALLDLFQNADHLASKAKYGAVPEDSSDDEHDDVSAAAAADGQLSEKEREKLKKQRDKELEEKKKRDKEAFKKAQKEAEKKGVALDNTWKLECDLIYADALFWRALIQLTMNSYLKGAYNLRSAWGCYLALLKELEADTGKRIPRELEMGIKSGAGIFYVYLAMVPSGLMTLLSAIGFISDRELGEQYLTEVIHSNTVRSPLASLCLLTYYLFLPTGLGNVHKTLEKAKPILDLMNARMPNNSYFWGYANFFHRKLGHTAEALESITHATANAERAGGVPLLLAYLQADTLYMSLQYEAARDKYKALLDTLARTKEEFAYTGQVIISLAACLTMLGDKPTAMAWLKKVEKMYNPKSKQDANSPKYAARVLAEPRLLPLIGVYVLYINRDLAHMKPDVVDKLQADLARATEGSDMTPVEVRGMYHLFIGVMHKACGRRDEANAAWAQVLALEKKLASDSMVLPFLFYEMGEFEYRAGNLLKAKELFDKGQSVKGDGHETLANRYNIAQKQLKREMKEKGLI
jgi:hypothetical protein